MNTNENYSPLILPRPVWVNDLDVSYCSSCNNAFGPLKRRVNKYRDELFNMYSQRFLFFFF